MTNPIAVFLALVIFAALGYDVVFLNGQVSLFLARKFADLIEWLAFWR